MFLFFGLSFASSYVFSDMQVGLSGNKTAATKLHFYVDKRHGDPSVFKGVVPSIPLIITVTGYPDISGNITVTDGSKLSYNYCVVSYYQVRGVLNNQFLVCHGKIQPDIVRTKDLTTDHPVFGFKYKP